MTARPERKERFRNLIGLSVLVLAFGWAVVHTAYLSFWKAGETTLLGDKRIIRFAHWQLEGGVVDALNDACRLYEQLHPDVDVQQIEVPERAYIQWVRTQQVGRTAPDLFESRFTTGTDESLVRYGVPITDRVNDPNPYNTKEMDRRLVELLGGDPERVADLGCLEGVPWCETYVDGMQAGWQKDLQDYYFMPLSVFTMRVFANKDLLEKAAGDLLRNPRTGELEGPQNLGVFFELCKRIEAYGKEIGETIIPIAGSDYIASMFRQRYTAMATWGLLGVQDINLDASVTAGERFRALASGDLNVATDPHIEAAHKVIFEISRHFNPGFMNAKREDSLFMFTQGKAAMVATGTWECGTLQKEIEGLFEIMAFRFPVPAPGQPYSEFIRYPESEAAMWVGIPMTLCRFSKHPDVAVDFMQFLSSRRINEWINLRFRWFPAIRGAETDPLLETFRPRPDGIYEVFSMSLYGRGELPREYNQRFQAFIGTNPPPDVPFETFLDAHYKQFIQGYADAVQNYAIRDFENYLRSSYNQAVQTEQQLSRLRAEAVHGGLTPELESRLLPLIWSQADSAAARARDVQYLRAAKEQGFGSAREESVP